jgi:hypothetical protein
MHRHREGFKRTEAFDFARKLAAEFSDSVNSSSTGSSSAIAASLIAEEHHNTPFGSHQGQYARRPSRFLQSTFRDNAGTKDDMAMPDRKKRLETLLDSTTRQDVEFFNNFAAECKADNGPGSPTNNPVVQKKPKDNKPSPKRVLSKDDSMVGNFVKLRLHPGDQQTTNKRSVLNSSSTSREDLSSYLIAKLGSKTIASHANNKAVGRRRASVNVLTDHSLESNPEPPAGGRDRSTRSRSRTPLRKGGDDKGGEGDSRSRRRHRHHGYNAMSHPRRRDVKSHSPHETGGGQNEHRQTRSNHHEAMHDNHHSDSTLNYHHSREKTGHSRHPKDSQSPEADQHHHPTTSYQGSREKTGHSRHPKDSQSPEADQHHHPTTSYQGSREKTGHSRHPKNSQSPEADQHHHPTISHHGFREKTGHSRHPKDSQSPEADQHHRRQKPREHTGHERGESKPSKDTSRRAMDVTLETAETSSSPKTGNRRTRGSIVIPAQSPSQPVSQGASGRDNKSRHGDKPDRHKEHNDRCDHPPSKERLQTGERPPRKLMRKRSKSTGNLTAHARGYVRKPKLGRRSSSSDHVKDHQGEGVGSLDGNHKIRSKVSPNGKDGRTLRYEAAAAARAQGDTVTLTPRSRRLSVQGLIKSKETKEQISLPIMDSIASSTEKLGNTEGGLPKPPMARKHRSDESSSPTLQAKIDAETSVRKLTLDTRRRRSISPRRRSVSAMGRNLTNQNSDEHNKSSRFKQALLRKQESGDDSEKLAPAGRPNIRRHSSLSKLETKSRKSLMVKDLSTHSLGGGKSGHRLSRTRMLFLDEAISFSDSDEEGDGDDGADRPTTSRKDADDFRVEEVDDGFPQFEEDFFEPSFSVPDIHASNEPEVPPFHTDAPAIPRSHRLTNDLNRVDLTALSASQVQLILARARIDPT